MVTADVRGLPKDPIEEHHSRSTSRRRVRVSGECPRAPGPRHRAGRRVAATLLVLGPPDSRLATFIQAQQHYENPVGETSRLASCRLGKGHHIRPHGRAGGRPNRDTNATDPRPRVSLPLAIPRAATPTVLHGPCSRRYSTKTWATRRTRLVMPSLRYRRSRCVWTVCEEIPSVTAMADSFWSSNIACTIWDSRPDSSSDSARRRQIASENTERPEGRTGRAPSSVLVGRAESCARRPGRESWRRVLRGCRFVTPASPGHPRCRTNTTVSHITSDGTGEKEGVLEPLLDEVPEQFQEDTPRRVVRVGDVFGSRTASRDLAGPRQAGQGTVNERSGGNTLQRGGPPEWAVSFSPTRQAVQWTLSGSQANNLP
jgi:hypothetical protein